MDALSFFKESIFADESAGRRGFLQSLDPRIKAAAFLLFILQILWTKNIIILLFLYALCLLLAQVSKINLGFFLRRTWIFIPLFSLLIAIPALFNFVTPGEPLATFSICGLNFTITRPGLSGAVLFIARVTTSVSFAVLLNITTRHFDLLKVLRIFRVPQLFVMTIGMCYRYIYLFAEIIEQTYLAIKSRAGVRVRQKKGRQIVAWNIACLWQRSYQLNEEVYGAMLSRGFSGEPRVLEEPRMRLRDIIFFCAALIVCALATYLGVRYG